MLAASSEASASIGHAAVSSGAEGIEREVLCVHEDCDGEHGELHVCDWVTYARLPCGHRTESFDWSGRWGSYARERSDQARCAATVISTHCSFGGAPRNAAH